MNHPPRNNLRERGGNHPSLVTSMLHSRSNTRNFHGHCFTSEPIPTSAAYKATFMCGFIEDILQQGFIFHKDIVVSKKEKKKEERKEEVNQIIQKKIKMKKKKK